jgi:hypothetical protein
MKRGLRKGGEFLDELNEYKFVNKVAVARSCSYMQRFCFELPY